MKFLYAFWQKPGIINNVKGVGLSRFFGTEYTESGRSIRRPPFTVLSYYL